MAEETLILDVSIAPLKQQLKDAKQELELARQKFGETSEEAVKAAGKVAEIKDAIEGAAEQAALFDPGNTFGAITTVASQAAGGIAAVQGAMALLGTESEDVNKALVKVQGALALSQGLSELKDFGKSFDAVKGAITRATTGLSGFGKALVATGIGAAIAAIGLLIAYWDDLKDAIAGTSDVTRLYNEAQKDVNKAVADANEKFMTVQVSIDLAKQGVLSKEEALRTYNEKLGDSLGKTSDFNVAERRLIELTPKYLKMIELKTRAQVFLAKSAELAAKAASGEEMEPGFLDMLWNSFKSGGNIAMFSAENAKTYANNVGEAYNQSKLFATEGKKFLEEALTLEKEIGTVATNEKYETDKKNSEKAAADRKAQLTKNAADYKAAWERAQKILADAKMSLLSQQEQEEQAITNKFKENKLALEKVGIQDFKDIEAQRDKELKEVRDKYRIEEEERVREYQNTLNQIQNDIKLAGMEEGFAKEKERIRINYADQIKEVELNEKLKAEEKKNIIDALKQQEELELAAQDEAAALAQYEKDIAEQDRTLAMNEGILSVEKQILDEKQRLTEEAYQNGLLTEQEYNDKVFEYSQQRQAIAEAEVENRRAINSALIGLAGQFGQTLQALAGKNKKVAIAGVVIEQAAAIGQIIANTAIANAKSVKQFPTTFGMPWVAINTASAALSIASTIANARKSIQQINSADTSTSPTPPAGPPPGGGGGAGGGAPVAAPPVPTIGNAPVSELRDVMNQRPQPVRAYVVESEVSANQQRVDDIRRRAEIVP